MSIKEKSGVLCEDIMGKYKVKVSRKAALRRWNWRYELKNKWELRKAMDAPEKTSCVSATVLVSYCCCNKLPQTWWLKTKQIYSFTNSGGQKSKIRFTEGESSCWQDWFLLETGRVCSLLLSASGGCKHSLASGCITPISASILTFSSPLCNQISLASLL